MNKTPFLLAALLAFPALSRANDTSVAGIGGRWQIVQKEHPSIRMVKEKIDLTLTPNRTYTTVAEFVFQNNGPATRVQMGFPESGYGDIAPSYLKSHPGFTHFKTWVDGVPFTTKRRVTSAGEGSFDALWVKTVPFKAHQTRRVRVSYQSDLGAMSSYPTSFLSYDFTGGNWRGNVASSVLTVHLDVPGTYLVSTDKFEKTKPQFQRQGNKFIYTWHNWQAEQAFAFRFDTTLRNWLGDGEITDLPVNINAPTGKLSESKVGYIPRGVVRGGQTFVNLRSWLDWAQAQKPGNEPLSSSYDPKTKSILVRRGSRVVSLPTKPETPGFTVETLGGNTAMFLPSTRLEKLFGASFKADLKKHALQFLK